MRLPWLKAKAKPVPRAQLLPPYPCPVCGQHVSYGNPRYPQHLCGTCYQRTFAADGRAVCFTNVSPADALPGMSTRAFYRDTAEPYARELCYVDGIACVAREAHLGGVAIQPLSAWRASPAWEWLADALAKQGVEV